MKGKTAKVAGVGALFVVAAAAIAVAEHVEPTVIDHEDDNNPHCIDYAPEGADWNQLKVEPLENGTFSDDDGNLTVNITVTAEEDDGGDATMFDWMSNIGVSSIVVKDGRHDHHLYEYDPAELADTGLTAGAHDNQAGKFGGISHVTFCYEDVNVTVPPDGNETPPPNGNETPPPDGNETPPPVFECPPVSLSAQAHGDTTITVTAEGLNESAELQRSAGGAFVKVADLDANSTSYFDTDTEEGVTYTYQLLIDGEVCAEVEVTAIPFFPGVAAALATGLGVLGYVGLRRRS